MSVTDAQFVPTYEEVIWERTTESRMSTVISLLPVSLQSRMSPFKSFRRSSSLGNINLRNDGRLVCSSSSPSSLPPSNKPRPLSVFASGADIADMPGIMGTCRDGSVTPRTDDSGDKRSSGVVTPAMDVMVPSGRGRASRANSPSGIHWRVANQGTNLIGMAAETGAEGQSGDFERQAFVDGLTYLLRSLPPNLDMYETEKIRSALPPQLYDKCNNPMDMGSSQGEAIPGGGGGYYTQQHNRHDRSLIRRIVQLVVVYTFLFAHFILPYVVLLLRSAASIERRYKVSEMVMANGMSLASAAGRRCSQLAGVVLNLDEGRVGQGLSRAVAWTVEEVTRGISDGVGEGLVVTRLK